MKLNFVLNFYLKFSTQFSEVFVVVNQHTQLTTTGCSTSILSEFDLEKKQSFEWTSVTIILKQNKQTKTTKASKTFINR